MALPQLNRRVFQKKGLIVFCLLAIILMFLFAVIPFIMRKSVEKKTKEVNDETEEIFRDRRNVFIDDFVQICRSTTIVKNFIKFLRKLVKTELNFPNVIQYSKDVPLEKKSNKVNSTNNEYLTTESDIRINDTVNKNDKKIGINSVRPSILDILRLRSKWQTTTYSHLENSSLENNETISTSQTISTLQTDNRTDERTTPNYHRLTANLIDDNFEGAALLPNLSFSKVVFSIHDQFPIILLPAVNSNQENHGLIQDVSRSRRQTEKPKASNVTASILNTNSSLAFKHVAKFHILQYGDTKLHEKKRETSNSNKVNDENYMMCNGEDLNTTTESNELSCNGVGAQKTTRSTTSTSKKLDTTTVSLEGQKTTTTTTTNTTVLPVADTTISPETQKTTSSVKTTVATAKEEKTSTLEGTPSSKEKELPQSTQVTSATSITQTTKSEEISKSITTAKPTQTTKEMKEDPCDVIHDINCDDIGDCFNSRK